MSKVKKQVAIVEDDKFFQKLLANYLKKRGVAVTTLMSGVELVEYLKKTEPSLVLLDLILPDMDGFDALENIKSNSLFDFSKIVVMTSLSQDKDRETILAYGIKDYINKYESSIQQISDIVNKYL